MQATDAGEAFMQKVAHTLLPKAEPAEQAAKAGAVQPKSHASRPSTLAHTASAAKKQVQCVPLNVISC